MEEQRGQSERVRWVGKEREWFVKSKLVDDVRVQYRLTTRWGLGASLHLWSQRMHPHSFS
jgi:hypothetical protein